MLARARRLLSLSLLALLFAAAPALAGFAPSNELIVEGEQLSPAIATDAAGDSLVVWSRDPVLGAPEVLEARRLAADGTLGQVFELAPGETGGDQPAVAIGPGGRAFVAWRFSVGFGAGTVKGRWIEPSGALGPVLTLMTGEDGKHDPVEIEVAVGPNGVADVIWRDQTDGNKIGLRRVSPNSVLSAALPNIAGGGGIETQLAGLPNGSTVVVWRDTGIEGVVVDGNLEFGAPVAISAPSLDSAPQLAVDSAGNGLVAWRGSLPGDQYEVGGRLLNPTGVPVGGEFPIDPPSENFIPPTIDVSADSLGDFLVAWPKRAELNKDAVYARGIDAGGAFAGPVQQLSAPGFDNSFPEAALQDAGVGPVAWASSGVPASTVEGRLLNHQAVPLTAQQQLFGESFGPEEAGSAPAAGVAAFLIGYAVSGSAQGAVVRRFMVPPSCSPSSATVVQGAPVTIPISCGGPALEGAQLVAQARHGIVSAFNPLVNGFVYTPLPGYEGSDSFTYRGINDGGTSAVTEVTIAVGKETVKPRVKKLRFIRKGKRFRLVLSEPAKAVIRVKSVRRINGKRRIKLVGKIIRQEAPVKSTIKVRGKLAKKLARGGKFRAIAVATDLAKNKSKPKRIAFRLKG